MRTLTPIKLIGGPLCGGDVSWADDGEAPAMLELSYRKFGKTILEWSGCPESMRTASAIYMRDDARGVYNFVSSTVD